MSYSTESEQDQAFAEYLFNLRKAFVQRTGRDPEYLYVHAALMMPSVVRARSGHGYLADASSGAIKVMGARVVRVTDHRAFLPYFVGVDR